jgi:hypothetical protein
VNKYEATYQEMLAVPLDASVAKSIGVRREDYTAFMNQEL